MAESKFKHSAVPQAGGCSVVRVEDLGDIPARQIYAIPPSRRDLSDPKNGPDVTGSRRGRPPKPAELV